MKVRGEAREWWNLPFPASTAESWSCVVRDYTVFVPFTRHTVDDRRDDKLDARRKLCGFDYQMIEFTWKAMPIAT